MMAWVAFLGGLKTPSRGVVFFSRQLYASCACDENACVRGVLPRMNGAARGRRIVEWQA